MILGPFASASNESCTKAQVKCEKKNKKNFDSFATFIFLYRSARLAWFCRYHLLFRQCKLLIGKSMLSKYFNCGMSCYQTQRLEIDLMVIKSNFAHRKESKWAEYGCA